MLVTKSSTQLPHTLNELKCFLVRCEVWGHHIQDSTQRTLCGPIEQSSRPIIIIICCWTHRKHFHAMKYSFDRNTWSSPGPLTLSESNPIFLGHNLGEVITPTSEAAVEALDITTPLAWDSPTLLGLNTWHPAGFCSQWLNPVHSELAASLRNSLASPRQIGQVRFDWKIQETFQVDCNDRLQQLPVKKVKFTAIWNVWEKWNQIKT